MSEPLRISILTKFIDSPSHISDSSARANLGLGFASIQQQDCLTKAMVTVRSAENDDDVRRASLLFQEYAASLSVDLSFQNFEDEVATLPGDYAPPHGRLFLALATDFGRPKTVTTERVGMETLHCAGCVALRKIDNEVCEMKRLYVSNAYRGHKIGRRLAEAAIAAAREIGYGRMRLDTLPEMKQAQQLYRELGFREISPYRYNPVVGTKFFELML